MMQKSLGYAIKKFRRFYRVPEKIAIFKKKFKLQNLSHELEQQLFCQKLLLVQYVTLFTRISKETGFLPYCLVKCMACL